MKTKTCRYCKEKFIDIDFPAQFNRMVTCGNPECMKLRRLERLGFRTNRN
jgi:hypothetical protein